MGLTPCPVLPFALEGAHGLPFACLGPVRWRWRINPNTKSQMILHRSATTMLPLYKLSSSPPKLFSKFRYSYSLLSNSSSSFRISLLWLSHPRRLGTVTTAAYRKEGGDSFFTEESVSWTSLGVSDKVSQALYNAGLGQPSLVQVPSSVLTLIYSLISQCSPCEQ